MFDGEVGGGEGSGFEGGVSGVDVSLGAEIGALPGNFSEAVFAAGGEDEASAVLGEEEGGGSADAGGGSGDEGDLVLKAGHGWGGW